MASSIHISFVILCFQVYIGYTIELRYELPKLQAPAPTSPLPAPLLLLKAGPSSVSQLGPNGPPATLGWFQPPAAAAVLAARGAAATGASLSFIAVDVDRGLEVRMHPRMIPHCMSPFCTVHLLCRMAV